MTEHELRAHADALQRRLDEAEQTIRALMGGEIDSVAHEPGATPMLLRAAQDQLRANEQLLRAVFDGAMDALLIARDDGHYVDANPAACRAFGVPKEQLLGRPISDFAAPDFALTKTWHDFLRDGYMTGEFTILRPDGQRRILDFSAVANVLPGLHLSAMRDMTDRRAADRSLREAEQRLRTVISNAPIILFAIDRDGTYTLHEGQAVERIGLKPGEIVGRSVFERQAGRLGANDSIRRALAGETTTGTFELGDRMFESTLVPIREGDSFNGVIGVAVDVTARNAAETALRMSEARFRALIEHGNKGIWLTSADGRIVYASPPAGRLVGREVGALVGTSINEVVLDDDREQLASSVAELVADPARAGLREFRVRHADGSIRWIEAMMTNLLGDPAVGAVVSNLRDITERKAADAALQQSRLELEQAQAVAHLGSWTAGADADVPIAWSAECARIFGGTLHEPPTLVGFFECCHPDDRAMVREASVRASEAADEYETEHRIIRPDRQLRWIHAKTRIEGSLRWDGDRPIVGKDGLGRGYRVVGTVQDVTERKQAQDALRSSDLRYRQIVEQTSDGVWMYDAAGVTTFMNRRMAEMLGCTVEEAIGQPIFTFMDTMARAEAAERLERRRRGIGGSGEFRLTRRDGSDLWVSIRADPLLDAAGKFESSLALLTDVTDQRKAASALRRTEEQLRQAQKMEAIGSLAGGVAHDFNNLLSVVLSYSEMMIDDLPAADPMRADLEEIRRAGQRATELTRQLLAFSRKQILKPSVLNLNEVITGVQKMLRRLLGEDVDLSLLMSPHAGMIHADAGQIEQVLMNLVVNARDAMPNGGSLTIETTNVVFDDKVQHASLAPGAYVMLAVTDTGTGMDNATQARIFEPFFTTKDKSKGTGLGLSTVYGIVQQSGGHIWVYSEPGKGSTFKIYLPRTDRAVTQAVPVLDDARTVAGTETILLVEDDPPVRSIVRTLLRKHGYHVLEAENGGEAFLVCEQFGANIHLLLTDVVMPRMSGHQLAQRLVLQRPDLKVLYMSGYTENTIVHHGVLDAGVDFLPKPITPEALLRKVREVLDRARVAPIAS